MLKKIICWVNETDKDELLSFNSGFNLEFVQFYEELSEANIYIIKLSFAAKIYDKFIKFMQAHSKSQFIFLEEEVLETEEFFTVRDEPNTVHILYNGYNISMLSPEMVIKELAVLFTL